MLTSSSWARIRVLTIAACFMLLLGGDYVRASYVKMVNVNMDLARNSLARRLSTAVRTMKRQNGGHLPSLLELEHRFRFVPDRGTPLSDYPNYDHATYDDHIGAPTFGGDRASMTPEELEMWEAMDLYDPETHGEENHPFVLLQTAEGRAKWDWLKKAGNWAGDRVRGARDAVVNTARGARDAVVNTGKAIVNTGKNVLDKGAELAKSAVETVTGSGTPGPCFPFDNSPEAKAFAALGRPKDGLWTHGNALFRWNQEAGNWQALPVSRKSTAFAASAAWKDVDQCSGFDTKAMNMCKQLDALNRPQPIAPPPVLEIFECPKSGGTIFSYDAGWLVTPIWYKYLPHVHQWEWSADKINWTPTAEFKQKGGQYNGRAPVEDNLDIIKALESYTTSGEYKMPSDFGQNWMVRGIRSTWRSFYDGVLGKVRQFTQQLREFSQKFAGAAAKFREMKSKFVDLMKEIGRIGGRVVFALLYGLLNGVLMGMLDTFGDAAKQCPDMANRIKAVTESFKILFQSIVDAFTNLHFRTIGAAFQRVFDNIKIFLKAVFDVVWTCDALKTLIGTMIVVIVVGFIVTMLFVMTGYGIVFKVIMAIVGLIFAIPFLITKLVSAIGHIVKIVSGPNREDHIMGAIEDVAGIVGCIIMVIFLYKGLKTDGPQAMAKIKSSKLGRFFGLSEAQASQGLSNAGKVTSAAKSAASGKKPNTSGLIDDAAKASDDAAKLSDDAARNSGGKNSKPGKGNNVADDAASTADDAAKGSGDLSSRRASRMAAGGEKQILGSSDDLQRASDAFKKAPWSDTQIADDLARVKAGKKPAWAGAEPGGITGPGPSGGQKIFWDKNAKVWRHGPQSVDPLSGKSLAGQPVAMAKDHLGNKQPAVDLCQVLPAFCQGKAPNFCQKFPSFCSSSLSNNKIPTAADGTKVTGMPRQRMPQIGGNEEKGYKGFLDFLKSKLGPKSNPKLSEVKMMDPSDLTPTQAEINLQKTFGIGDGLVAGKGRVPPPTIVTKDGYILDGHHRWSAFKWSKMQGGTSKMPVRVLDMTIDEAMKACLQAWDIDAQGQIISKFPDIVTFAGLLQIEEHRKALKQAWMEAVRRQMDQYGMAPRDEESMEAMWEEFRLKHA